MDMPIRRSTDLRQDFLNRVAARQRDVLRKLASGDWIESSIEPPIVPPPERTPPTAAPADRSAQRAAASRSIAFEARNAGEDALDAEHAAALASTTRDRILEGRMQQGVQLDDGARARVMDVLGE
jgi:hypothetical protein